MADVAADVATLTTPDTLTMTSRDIAAYTGKEHFNVLVDIRKMLADLDLTALSFQVSYKDTSGRSLPMFNLPKDLTITLVSGYSVPMRHAIVTRWQELEAQKAPAIQVPTTFREALLLAGVKYQIT